MSDRQDSAAQAVARQAETAPGRLTYGRISMVVPSGVTRQSSSISSSVSAMQPAVQSFRPMKRANPAASIWNSVDHDVKTGGDTALCRASVIVIRWIGNVQRKMKAALRIPAVDLVDSFRRFHVALLFLRPDRAAAQCNAISLELPAVAKDRQFPGRFFDDDPIDRRSRGRGCRLWCA